VVERRPFLAGGCPDIGIRRFVWRRESLARSNTVPCRDFEDIALMRTRRGDVRIRPHRKPIQTAEIMPATDRNETVTNLEYGTITATHFALHLLTARAHGDAGRAAQRDEAADEIIGAAPLSPELFAPHGVSGTEAGSHLGPTPNPGRVVL